jgi:hypothetical protein
MFSVFSTTDLGNGFTLVEPPAGLIPEINKRLKIYSDETGNLTSNVWAAVFVLACLHTNGIPVVSTILDGYNLLTIREAFSKLPDSEFKEIVEEFLYSVNRSTLEQWFEAVDRSCYITKKTTDEIKNG